MKKKIFIPRAIKSSIPWERRMSPVKPLHQSLENNSAVPALAVPLQIIWNFNLIHPNIGLSLLLAAPCFMKNPTFIA
jgi:hypothetical protein